MCIRQVVGRFVLIIQLPDSLILNNPTSYMKFLKICTLISIAILPANLMAVDFVADVSIDNSETGFAHYNLTWPARLGMGYEIEASESLEAGDWETEDFVYGMGGTGSQRVLTRDLTPGTTAPPATVDDFFIHSDGLQTQSFTGEALAGRTDVLLRWTGANDIQYGLLEPLDFTDMPVLSSFRGSVVNFLVFRSEGVYDPAFEALTFNALPPSERQKIQDLRSVWPDVELKIIEPYLSGAQSPPTATAPVASGGRKFYRVREISLDSDNDGLTDWQEWFKTRTNPFAAKSNGSTADGSLDSDGDGVSNAAELANGTDPNDFYNGNMALFGVSIESEVRDIENEKEGFKPYNVSSNTWNFNRDILTADQARFYLNHFVSITAVGSSSGTVQGEPFTGTFEYSGSYSLAFGGDFVGVEGSGLRVLSIPGEANINDPFIESFSEPLTGIFFQNLNDEIPVPPQGVPDQFNDIVPVNGFFSPRYSLDTSFSQQTRTYVTRQDAQGFDGADGVTGQITYTEEKYLADEYTTEMFLEDSQFLLDQAVATQNTTFRPSAGPSIVYNLTENESEIRQGEMEYRFIWNRTTIPFKLRWNLVRTTLDQNTVLETIPYEYTHIAGSTQTSTPRQFVSPKENGRYRISDIVTVVDIDTDLTLSNPSTRNEVSTLAQNYAFSTGQESVPTVLLGVNSDDDDGNGISDHLQLRQGQEDDDIARVDLSFFPIDTLRGVVQIDLPSGIRGVDERGVRIPGQSIRVNLNNPAARFRSAPQGTLRFWIEALPGSSGGDITYTYRSDAGIESKTARVVVVDMQRLISDQIAGSECNLLPTTVFDNAANNPMLMATRSGNTAFMVMETATTSSIGADLRLGVREINSATILGSTPMTGMRTSLGFSAVDGNRRYEAVCGVDWNRDGILGSNEASVVFRKTPPVNSSGTFVSDPAGIRDSFDVVTIGDFNKHKSTMINEFASLPFIYAADLVGAFAAGSSSVPDAVTTGGIPLSSSNPSLTHPVGAKWDMNCNATMNRFTFVDGTPASDDVERSNGIREMVDTVITKNRALLVSNGSSSLGYSPPIAFTELVDFGQTDRDFRIPSAVFLAFGRVNIAGTIRIFYRMAGSTVEVSGYELNASFEDLYDFNYGNGGRSAVAASVQAGHASHSTVAEPSGRVFITSVELDSGFSLFFGEY